MSYEINDPRASFNAAIEQLLLVEHHAAGEWDPAHPKGRWCPPCVQKHARTAAALADEAIVLSGHAEPYPTFARHVRHVADLADQDSPPHTICQAARAVRRAFIRQ